MLNDSTIAKEQIRCCLSSYYDLQKLRISTGNRLVSSFYSQLGLSSVSGDVRDKPIKVDELDKEQKHLLGQIKSEYYKITKAIVEK